MMTIYKLHEAKDLSNERLAENTGATHRAAGKRENQ